MNPQSSQTGFVDSGTALANIPGVAPGRSRNIFLRDNTQDMVDVTHLSGATATATTAIPDAPPSPQARAAGEWEWLIEPKPVLSVPQQVTLPLAIWEGVVEEIDTGNERFYAHLMCKSIELDEHRVEIMISSIELSDMDLLDIGAVFYLEQYQRNRRGGREQTQILRFRRCVTWTQTALDWARNEARAMDTVLRPYIEPKDDDE